MLKEGKELYVRKIQRSIINNLNLTFSLKFLKNDKSYLPKNVKNIKNILNTITVSSAQPERALYIICLEKQNNRFQYN